jgi:hypothetical protein
MNTGVMLMNVKNLIAVDGKFKKFVISIGNNSLLGPIGVYRRPRKKLFYRYGGIDCPSGLTGSRTGEITQAQR